MRRSDFLRKYFGKFIAALVLVGLIVYTLFHALGFAGGNLLTTPARRVTDTQILGGEAYLFRSEELIRTDREGLINDLVESGSKVGRDVKVAQVHENQTSMTDAEAQKLIDRFSRIIAALEKGQPDAGESLSHAKEYKEKADAAFVALKTAIESGDLSAAAELEDDMLTYLCRHGMLTGTDAEAGRVLTTMKGSREALLGGSYTDVVNTLSSGYFYNRSYVDGGEEIFTDEALESLTVESFSALCKQFETAERESLAVGKMVYEYDWHIAVGMDASASELLQVGGIYYVVFPENEDVRLELTCQRIVTDGAKGSVVILQVTDSPIDFEYLRAQRVEIEVSSCRGYYVPEQALTTIEGTDGSTIDGVYIFENSTVYFRWVRILYRGDGYVIVDEQGDHGADYLALNDIIVTSGFNLYHGRVYQ